MRCIPYVVFSSLAALAPTLIAGDFRIETKIYSADDLEKPISENLTLYQAGVFYDFLTGPNTVTIFRPPQNDSVSRFVILDPARKEKTEIATDQIQQLLAKLQRWAAEQEDSFVRFLANPEFAEETLDGKSLILKSDHMVYRVEMTEPVDEESLVAFRQFSDWYARFNARGGMLPFPRLAVNEALFRQRRVPTRVELTLPAQDVTLIAEHRITWRLSKQDRKATEEALRQMGAFDAIEPAEFVRGLESRVANAGKE